MRIRPLVCVMMGIWLAARVEIARGQASLTAEPQQTERLIAQLGDPSFKRREAVAKELETIGEPALTALRRAAACSTDFEVRTAAERIVRTIADDGQIFVVPTRIAAEDAGQKIAVLTELLRDAGKCMLEFDAQAGMFVVHARPETLARFLSAHSVAEQLMTRDPYCVQVVQLNHANAVVVSQQINNFYNGGCSPPIYAVGDTVSNKIVVSALRRDLLEVEEFIKALDVPTK